MLFFQKNRNQVRGYTIRVNSFLSRDKHKVFVFFGALCILLFVLGVSVFALLNDSERDNLLQSSNSPPIIDNVVIEPLQPTSKDEVKVTATIYSDSSVTEDKPTAATLLYSVDKEGKNWEKVDMEQSESDEKIWQAVIPSQENGTMVRYFIQASDTSNTIASESPGTVTVQSEKPDEWLPSDYQMALVSDDEDDDEKAVPDHLDLRKIYAGYDEKYFYVKIIMQGNIPTASGECATQPLYYLQAGNLDKGWLHYGWLFYRPCVYNNGPNLYGFVQRDWWNEQIRDARQIDQVIKDNVLYWRWKRDIQNSPKSALWLYFEDRTGVPPEKIKYYNDKQLQDIKVYVEAIIVFWAKDIYDLSAPIRFYLTTHSYEVK